jgi:hypothetical protein
MEFTAGETGSVVFFAIDLFFLLSICSFGGRPYARKKWTAIPKGWLLSTFTIQLDPDLSREGSAPVRLGADFRSAQPCSELPWARARLETPLTILPKSYNSRQTVATESAHSSKWPKAADST